MIRFAHSEYLYALYLLPLLVIIFILTQRKQTKQLLGFAGSKLHRVLLPFRSRFKAILKFGMTLFAMLLIVIAIANPQIGSKIEEVKQVGIDVFILLDVSLSMTAEDIKPNRLEKAKHQIARLVEKLQGDRIGLIVFSGEAYIQFPMTTDYSAANLFLSAVDVTSVPQAGTAIEPAIKLALNSFKMDSDTKKAIVIITDGEDHEGNILEIVEEAANKGVQIYTIGLGSPSGVPIPIYNSAGVQVGYKKDRRGNVVLTKLDEKTLQEIANVGHGKYYRGSNTEDELDLIYSDLGKLEASEFGATRITDYEDRFYYFLLPGLLILLAEFFVSSKKSKFMIRMESN
jgi:Ca-activated chloride channel family protein